MIWVIAGLVIVEIALVACLVTTEVKARAYEEAYAELLRKTEKQRAKLTEMRRILERVL